MQMCAACTSVVKLMVTRETTEPGLVGHDNNLSTSLCVILWANLVCEASSSPTKVA